MATPLTDAINALTTYTNEVTGKSDTNLSDAVYSLAEGYGQGGASNIVTGTFKGTTTGAAMDVDFNYSGNGYPVAIVIYPKEGAYNASSGTIYRLVQRYVALWYGAYKEYADSAPNYNGTGNADRYTVSWRYKNSTSNATTYAHVLTTSVLFSSGKDAYDPSIVRLKSKTKMSVYIADSSYGFAANVEYTYHVIYSS